ncbi:NAD(P)H-quinone oxidoreductase [Aquibaculum sediminis]|uniref:NAD(P)H-quinone oxidoreductase n=1 Tax=Aquibaculum sediminis TaxID=3231907 RepID=UPI0034560370
MSALPETMQAIEIKQPGGPEVLQAAQRPVPTPGPGEVLIRVAAAGVNRPDVFQRQGNYAPPPGATDIPGLELAGEIVACGEGVQSWSAGDQVCALVSGGGYAEYCVAPAAQCLPLPRGLGLLEAAALPENYFTVWSNVFDRGGLREGEVILIHGGSSGIGTTAIQLAKAYGARVFATAGSDEKCRTCEELGAEKGINYRNEDFVEAVREATADASEGKGADLILDMVGGDYIPRDLRLLRPDGRLVLIAFLGGSKAEVDFQKLMVNRLTITGSTLRPRPISFKAAIAANLQAKIWPMLESGQVRPLIHRTFPLAQAAEAHALMESSSHIGKIMLTT